MKSEAFKPTGTMKPATLVSMGGMPRPTRMGPAPAPSMAAMAPGGTAISQKKESSFNPHGQQIKLMGAPSPLAPQGPAPAPEPRRASFQPQGQQLEMAGPPVPSAAAPRSESVFRVSLRGRNPDGSEWVSQHDAVFPGSGVQVGAAEVHQIS